MGNNWKQKMLNGVRNCDACRTHFGKVNNWVSASDREWLISHLNEHEIQDNTHYTESGDTK